jgi:hypothetical protein
MHKFFIVFFLILASTVSNAQNNMALNNVLPEWIHDNNQVGKHDFNFLLLPVYNIKLYAPKGQYLFSEPHAIEIQYLRDFSNQSIAKRSIEEIQKQGFKDAAKLSSWHDQLEKTIPSVKNKDKLLGIKTKNQTIVLFKNNKKMGEILDPLLAKHFFDIWLSPKTSEPKMRQSLLGLKK